MEFHNTILFKKFFYVVKVEIFKIRNLFIVQFSTKPNQIFQILKWLFFKIKNIATGDPCGCLEDKLWSGFQWAAIGIVGLRPSGPGCGWFC